MVWLVLGHDGDAAVDPRLDSGSDKNSDSENSRLASSLARLSQAGASQEGESSGVSTLVKKVVRGVGHAGWRVFDQVMFAGEVLVEFLELDKTELQKLYFCLHCLVNIDK